MKKSNARKLIDKLNRDTCGQYPIGTPGKPEPIAQDSHQWFGLAFDLAAAADTFHGHLVPDYRPGLGGSRGDLMESTDAYTRKLLRQHSASTLERACLIAYRYGKMLEASYSTRHA